MIAPASRKLGKYEIRQKLGRGGMADVYLAQDTETGQTVALKLIEHSADADTCASIEAEMRGATLQARLSDVDPRVVHGFYRAYWVDGRPPSDEATLREVLGAAGHDAGAILEAIARPEAKDDLRRRTDEAVGLGIFGAPAFVVAGARMYWGQDRMHFVERDLLGRS